MKVSLETIRQRMETGVLFTVDEFILPENDNSAIENHLESVVNMMNRLGEEYLTTKSDDYLETIQAIMPNTKQTS